MSEKIRLSKVVFITQGIKKCTGKYAKYFAVRVMFCFLLLFFTSYLTEGNNSLIRDTCSDDMCIVS